MTEMQMDDVFVYRVSTLTSFRKKWLKSLDVCAHLDAEDEEPMSLTGMVLASIRDVVGAAHAPTMSEMFA